VEEHGFQRPGSIKGDVKRKTSSDQIGEGYSASSPLWDLHTAGAGVLGTAKIPVCGVASVRICPDFEATQAAVGWLSTMVLSETQGL